MEYLHNEIALGQGRAAVRPHAAVERKIGGRGRVF